MVLDYLVENIQKYNYMGSLVEGLDYRITLLREEAKYQREQVAKLETLEKELEKMIKEELPLVDINSSGFTWTLPLQPGASQEVPSPFEL